MLRMCPPFDPVLLIIILDVLSSYWHTNQTYVNRTISIMETLTSMFENKSDVVPIIQIMNESVPRRFLVLSSFDLSLL